MMFELEYSRHVLASYALCCCLGLQLCAMQIWKKYSCVLSTSMYQEVPILILVTNILLVLEIEGTSSSKAGSLRIFMMQSLFLRKPEFAAPSG